MLLNEEVVDAGKRLMVVSDIAELQLRMLFFELSR